MKREIELRILEVNRSELTSKLPEIGFIYVGQFKQKGVLHEKI